MKGELVVVKLYEAGRSIDVDKFSACVPGIKGIKLSSKKEVPYITLPRPLVLDLASTAAGAISCAEHSCVGASLTGKIYDEGVVSLVLRVRFDGIPVVKVHVLRDIHIRHDGFEHGLDAWLDIQFALLFEKIEPFLDVGMYLLDPPETLSYKASGFWDDVGNPRQFIDAHRKYIAAFLLGENPDLRLHEVQVSETVSNAFSFLENDVAILDMERCIIIDPSQDYEDILVVVELASYQLLELRALNRVLDSYLGRAEVDFRLLHQKKKLSRLSRKVVELSRISVDATFLLSKIENISTITGDYYLADVFRHLGMLFHLVEWSKSVRTKLGTLQDLYASLKTDRSERVLLWVEIILAVIFGLEFGLFLAEFFR